MKHLIPFLCIFAQPVCAEYYSTGGSPPPMVRGQQIVPKFKVFSDPKAGDIWEHRIVILNKDGTSTHKLEIDTPSGLVVMNYFSRPGDNNPDLIQVVSWPEGYAVSETEVNVGEESTATIYLIKFIGV